MLRRLIRDQRGAQMIEYVILIGMVVLLVLAAFKKFGWTLRENIDKQNQTVGSDDD